MATSVAEGAARANRAHTARTRRLARRLDCGAMPDATPPPTLSRRQLLAGAAAVGSAPFWPAPANARPRQARSNAAATPTLRLLAHGSLAAGTDFKNTLVGGLSGLAWDASSDLWYALSDDRSRHAPARIYVFRLPPLTSGQPLLPQWVDVITLLGADSRP